MPASPPTNPVRPSTPDGRLFTGLRQRRGRAIDDFEHPGVGTFTHRTARGVRRVVHVRRCSRENGTPAIESMPRGGRTNPARRR
jgi:hypothetical protein